jgi:hypothetical protein
MCEGSEDVRLFRRDEDEVLASQLSLRQLVLTAAAFELKVLKQNPTGTFLNQGRRVMF